MNSAVELLARGLCSEQNADVGKALDVASGAVLVASFLRRGRWRCCFRIAVVEVDWLEARGERQRQGDSRQSLGMRRRHNFAS